MGVNINQVLALCFGFGAIMAGFDGTLLSMCYPINTNMGLEYTVIAIIVVALGGLGSIVGCLVGGLILGFIMSFGSTLIDPIMANVIAFALILLVLIFRPRGVMGRVQK